MMQTSFPRLLVAAECPANDVQGSPVMRLMLKGWPVENLFWWSCHPDGRNEGVQAVADARCASIPRKLYPQEKWCGLKSLLMEKFWSPFAAAHLQKTIRDFAPEVIWVVPQSWSVPPIARTLLGKEHNYHVSIHDYVDSSTRPQRFGRERCERFGSMLDQLYAHSTTCDTISEPMAEDMSTRTGRQAAQIVRFGVEAADFERLMSKTPRRGDSIRIAYTGTILVEEVFQLFVAALERIRPSLAKRVELHLFGGFSMSGRRWFNRDWMIEHGVLNQADFLAQVRDCDWGFSAMGLRDDDPRYSRYSFPNKFITYLSLGLPIITLGHKESAVMKVAAKYNVGLCSDATDAGVLADQLRAVLDGPDSWERCGPEIIRCARAEFDAEAMRTKLHQRFFASVAP